MWFKIIFTSLASILGIIAFLPYLRDTLLKKTKPHVFTWLIWSITQSTAIAGIWYGGGGIGAIALTIGTILVITIFFLSFRQGEKNITQSDTVVLLLALLAIAVWWFLKSPLLSILMVTAIDVSGFIPTFRKSFNNPQSETLSTWLMFATSNICAIIALESYNLLTITYVTALAIAESVLVIFLLIRRKTISAKK